MSENIIQQAIRDYMDGMRRLSIREEKCETILSTIQDFCSTMNLENEIKKLSADSENIKNNAIAYFGIDGHNIEIDANKPAYNSDEDKILNAAIKHFGKKAQIIKTVEELGELITAIARYQNFQTIYTTRNMCEEIADVEIMLSQLRMIIRNTTNMFSIDAIKRKKLNRLAGMLPGVKEGE